MYETTELKGLEHLTGRVIVQFDKGFRASYLIGGNYGDQLFVAELRGERMSVGDFPGYNAVLLPFRLLCTIFRQELPSWKSTLSSVAGVYAITDTKTGKPYVGSAYGGEGIWQRWAAYADSGHGGNKEIKELLAAHGADYCQNFRFSILEVTDRNASEDYIINREKHWKNVLMSREYGYNRN